MKNRHTPIYPGAMTQAQKDHRFVCDLITFIVGFTLTAAFMAMCVLLNR